MPRIIVLDELSHDGLALLKSAGNIEVAVQTGLKGDALRTALAESDGAICRSGVKITAEALEGNRRLKAIARAGVGVDNIDTAAATRLGIVVMNTPAGNTLSTAEHTLTMMLALSRNVCPAYQSLIEAVGPQALYGHATGRQDPGDHRPGPNRPGRGQAGDGHGNARAGLRSVSLGPAGQGAGHPDVPVAAGDAPPRRLSHGPHAADRRNAKPHQHRRGPPAQKGRPADQLRPRRDLRRAGTGRRAQERAPGRGGLDVYAEEPCTNSPLFGMPNVVCTPHLGASTEEAQANVALEAAELLIDFFTTGAIRQAVNMAALDPKTMEGLRGYLDLAYRLGILLSQVDRCPPISCKIRYKGDVAKKETRLISAAFAAGLLEEAMDEPVNLVNSEVLLQQRGIDLIEERNPELGDFSSLITGEVISESKTSVAAGTLFGQNMPRLVQKGQCRLESYLDGIQLIFIHRDVPGIIGKVGTSSAAIGSTSPRCRSAGPPTSPAARRSASWRRFGAAGRGPCRDPQVRRGDPRLDRQASAPRPDARLAGRLREKGGA